MNPSRPRVFAVKCIQIGKVYSLESIHKRIAQAAFFNMNDNGIALPDLFKILLMQFKADFFSVVLQEDVVFALRFSLNKYLSAHDLRRAFELIG